ncbi:hypothetical protein JDV09_21960 [Mycobacterium sp. Y57]|nr:hypothetical protein [Mycolicibacterium xanthum]
MMTRLAMIPTAAATLMLAATATAGADPTPGPAPAPIYIPGCTSDQPAQERPEQMLYNCDGSAAMEGMTWTSWGPDGAMGTGVDNAVQCKPNCAEGPHLINPIIVHAWNPRPVDGAGCPAGALFYADLTIAYPEGVPPWIVPGTTWERGVDFVTIDGMPAVHWTDRMPFGCQIPGP